MDTRLALNDLALRLSFATRELANQLRPSAPSEPSPDPEETEHWLRWMKIALAAKPADRA